MMRLAFLTALLSVSVSAFAARPFMTDDARLTTSGSCQLESWTRIYKDSTQKWALPACNPTGNFEVTLGGGHTKDKGEVSTNDYVLQGKSLFRELNTNDYGWGLAVGTVNHPSKVQGPNALGNTYAYVPLSISTLDDKVIYHTNLGWLRDKETREYQMTFGFGAEIQARDRVLAIAEVFGNNKERPYWQTGARYSVIPNLLQVDMTVGEKFNGLSSTRWISFGLRYIPDSIF